MISEMAEKSRSGAIGGYAMFCFSGAGKRLRYDGDEGFISTEILVTASVFICRYSKTGCKDQ
jgi:hypothetical protein